MIRSPASRAGSQMRGSQEISAAYQPSPAVQATGSSQIGDHSADGPPGLRIASDGISVASSEATSTRAIYRSLAA